MSGDKIRLVYDGECPVCSAYSRMLALNDLPGEVEIISARADHPVVNRLKASGLDLDEGFVLMIGERVYHGAEAIHVLALISGRSGLFNRVNHAVFRSPALSRALYPVLRAGRGLLLTLLGRKRIAA